MFRWRFLSWRQSQSLLLPSVLDGRPVSLALTGLAAGFAAFTKNEGLPFALLIAIVALWRARGTSLWLAAGAMPGIAATLAVKMMAQGTEAILPKSAGEALHKIAEPSRWMQILKSFAVHFGEMGVWWAHPLLLLVVTRRRARRLVSKEDARSRAWLALPIAGLLAADFASTWSQRRNFPGT
jgi:hypothetical protein